jgi:hypothetical protein
VIALAVAVILAVVILAWLYVQRRRRTTTAELRHPRVVANYRSAHEIAVRLEKSEASTEDLRTATLHYRSLFEELVQVPTAAEIKEVA